MVEKGIKQVLNRPFYYDFSIENDTIYFPMAGYNALCKGSLLEDKIEIINTFPNIPLYKWASYIGIYKFEDYLLFSPYNNTDNFCLYDIKHNSFIELENKEKFHFYSTEIFNKDNILFIVSKYNAGVYRIDLHTLKIQCVESKFITNNAMIFEILRVNNHIFIPINRQKMLLLFDLEKETFQYYNYPLNISTIYTLCYQHNQYWITGEDRKLYLWNIESERALECEFFPEYIRPFYLRKNLFGNSLIDKNILWLFPIFTDSILKYNILTQSFERLLIDGEEECEKTIEDELKAGRPFPAKFGMIKRYNNKVYFVSSKTRILYELDLTKNELRPHLFFIDNIYKDHIYPYIENEIVKEEKYMDGLNCLLRALNKHRVIITESERKKGNSTVYNYVKQKILKK